MRAGEYKAQHVGGIIVSEMLAIKSLHCSIVNHRNAYFTFRDAGLAKDCLHHVGKSCLVDGKRPLAIGHMNFQCIRHGITRFDARDISPVRDRRR